jgi:hypothetical protein
MAVLISKYQLVEEIYTSGDVVWKSKDLLEDALENLYVALMMYQMKIVTYIQSKSEFFKGLFVPVNDSLPHALLGEITQLEDAVSKQSALTTGEAVLSIHSKVSSFSEDLRTYLNEQEKSFDVMTSGLTQISQKVESKYRSNVLTWISPILYETPHTTVEKNLTPGTTDWILQNERYQDWSTSDDSDRIWLFGSMGTGKSFIAHEVIEDRKLACKELGWSFILAYFYCDAVNERKEERFELTTENIIACILKQVMISVKTTQLPQAACKLYEDHHDGARGPTESQCLDLLSAVANQLSMVTLVIDGLDECESSVQEELLQTLKTKLEFLQIPVKICISSRHEHGIEESLMDWVTNRVNIVDHSKAALHKMIEEKVKEASSTRKTLYHHAGQDLTQRVIDELQNNAGGMFRWAQMALDYLNSSKLFKVLVNRLGQLRKLPKLFDLYDTIYGKMMSHDSIEDEWASVISTALIFLLFGYPTPNLQHDSPRDHLSVRTNHVLEACTLATKEGSAFEASEIVDLCPSFIVLDESPAGHNETILRLPHFSVKEYLTERHAEIYSEANGHAHLASLCIRHFSDIGSLEDAKADSFVEYASDFWLDHMVSEEMARRLGAQSQSQITDARAQYTKAVSDFLSLPGPSPRFKAWHMYKANRLVDGSKWKNPRIDGYFGISQYAHSSPSCSALLAHVILGTEFDTNFPSPFANDVTVTRFDFGLPYANRSSIDLGVLHLASLWGRPNSISWILQPQKGSYKSKRRCTSVIEFLGLPIGGIKNLQHIEKYVEQNSLLKAIQCLMHARVEIPIDSDLWGIVVENDGQDHMYGRAVSKVLRHEDYMFDTDEDGDTIIDRVLQDAALGLNLGRFLKYLALFFKHSKAALYRDRWLRSATLSIQPRIVAYLIDQGADPRTRQDGTGNALERGAETLGWHPENLQLGRSAEELATLMNAAELREVDEGNRTGVTAKAFRISRGLREASHTSFELLMRAANLEFDWQAKCSSCDRVSQNPSFSNMRS